VSRTPVREALILLEREGLVVASPNRGCFVRAFTPEDVGYIFSMRTTLENFAGELIIELLADADFDYLRGSVERHRAAIQQGDFKQVRTIDVAFHQYLVCKSEHPLLIRQWTEIVAQIAAMLYLRAEFTPNYDEYQAINDHQGIVDAYQKRDLSRLKALNQQINQRVAAECLKAVIAREANGL
jgi:DNA-binding GntR family transcriptional regulator